jgi:putative ABC transport system substrate-binding protein
MSNTRAARNILASCVAVWLWLVTCGAWAGQPARISAVFTSEGDAYKEAWSGFKAALVAENVTFSASEFVLDNDEKTEVFGRIDRGKSDLALTFGTKASRLATGQLARVPVVFCMVLDQAHISSTNSTGVTMDVPIGVKLHAVKRILPHVNRIGLVYSPETSALYAEILEKCAEMGVIVVARRIGSEKELMAALKAIMERADCFLMIPDTKLYTPASVRSVLLESLRSKFPVIGLSSQYTKAGALFSVDSDYVEIGKQAAELAVRVLRGEDPAGLAIQPPRKTRLSINLAVAQRLGIEIPAKIMKEANEVYGS